jgi:hypothetical protein
MVLTTMAAPTMMAHQHHPCIARFPVIAPALA